MTSPARIGQDDMDRAMKAVARSGLKSARIVMDLSNRKIEIIIGGLATRDHEGEDFEDEDR